MINKQNITPFVTDIDCHCRNFVPFAGFYFAIAQIKLRFLSATMLLDPDLMARCVAGIATTTR